MKQFKSLEAQINYLQDYKNIYFNNSKVSENTLLDSNYYNLVSCSKIKFAQSIEKGKHIYNKHSFQEWHEYFLTDCKVSEYLMGNLIEFERIINSRTAYYIGELINTQKLGNREYNEVVQLIQDAEIKNLPDYLGKETWKYISKMTFGELKRLLFWLIDHKGETFNSIVSGYPYLRGHNVKDRLNDIVQLRNFIFHFTPINIYLAYAYRHNGELDNTYRKATIRFIYKLNPDNGDIRESMKDIFQCSDNFIKIKKQSTE